MNGFRGILLQAAALIASTGIVVGAAQAIDLPEPMTNDGFHDEGQPNEAKVALGRDLFFDKVLSGNKNIACATCHHPLLATGDGLSLSTGEGGSGLGPAREAGTIVERVPRNAPPLFGLGAKEFKFVFHDRRIQVTEDRFVTPAGDLLPEGLENALAAQAMFPVTSATEMAGLPDQLENEIAPHAEIEDFPSIWNALAQRLRNIDDYVAQFVDVFDDVNSAEDITYVHAANAIAAFEMATWRGDDTPFNSYLKGDKSALTLVQKQGMQLFYGRANCASCHTGVLGSDQQCHSIAMPQVGPGKGQGVDGIEDLGCGAIEANQNGKDYTFRTPPLLHVFETGPYGHDGAYATLSSVIQQHVLPKRSIVSYYCGDQLVLSSSQELNHIDCLAHNNQTLRDRVARSRDVNVPWLTGGELVALLAFLKAWTSESGADPLDQAAIVPATVPSGLPVDD